MNEVFEELKNLSNDGIYSRKELEWWVLKNELRYKDVCRIIDTLNDEFPDLHARSHVSYDKDGQFLTTYEVLLDVIECYKNESYHKGEMVFYNKIRNDKEELGSWLQMHKLDEGKMQSKFKQLFENTSRLSGFEFILRHPFMFPILIKFSEADFQYTLDFIDILKN